MAQFDLVTRDVIDDCREAIPTFEADFGGDCGLLHALKLAPSNPALGRWYAEQALRMAKEQSLSFELARTWRRQGRLSSRASISVAKAVVFALQSAGVAGQYPDRREGWARIWADRSALYLRDARRG